MTTNFPGTGIDSFPTHATGDVIQASYDNNEQDAIVALETKVGVNGSAVSTTHDFKLSGVTTSDKAASLTGTENLTNKTLTSPKILVGSDATLDIYYNGGSGVLARLAKGSTLQQLRMNSGATALEWFTPTATSDASYATKGIVEFLTDAATSGITVTAGVANVNYGTSANQIVKLDASAKLPAVDGSALTNIYGSVISTQTINTAIGNGTFTKIAEWTSLTGDSDDIYELNLESLSSDTNVVDYRLRLNDSTSSNYFTIAIHFGQSVLGGTNTTSVNGVFLSSTGNNVNTVFFTKLVIKASKTIAGTTRIIIGQTSSSPAGVIGDTISFSGGWADVSNQITSVQVYAAGNGSTPTLTGKATLYKIKR